MIGFNIVFKIRQSKIRREIKHQIKEGIPGDKLREFTLSNAEYNQLNWVKQGKEFRKSEEMFDIVRSERFGDSIQIKCVNDIEEAMLFAQLEEMIQKKMDQESSDPSSPLSKMVKTLKLVYITPDSKVNLAYLSENQSRYFSYNQHLYSSPYLELLTPPPDTI